MAAKTTANGKKQDLQPIKQISGQGTATATAKLLWGFRRARQSLDLRRPKYNLWDKMRAGREPNLEFAGLFINPIVQKYTAYVLGDKLKLRTEDDYTNSRLLEWVEDNLSVLTRAVEDHYALGDTFIFVDTDGQLYIPSPDLVDPEWDVTNYRRMIAYTITTELDDYTITDRYEETRRVVTFKAKDGKTKDHVEIYANPFGRLPVAHLPCERGANEIFGHPIIEAMYTLLGRYDDLMIKGLSGAERMGSPIPTFQGVEDAQAMIDRNKASDTEEYTDQFGTSVERTLINFDRDGVIIVGPGVEFKFSAPMPGFTTDVRNMLESLFYLILEFTGIPEYIWGGAIASSKASAEVQEPPFIQLIKRLRLMLLGMPGRDGWGLLYLFALVLQAMSFTDPRIMRDRIQVMLPPLPESSGDTRTKELQYFHKAGALTDETALEQSSLDVYDIPGEVERGHAQRDAAMEAARDAEMAAADKILQDGAPA